MLGASFFFSIMAMLVKTLEPRIPPQEIVFARSVLNVAFTLALIARYRVSALGRNRLTLLLRGICGYVALSCYFYTIHVMPLADAVLIHNTFPILVALLAPLVLREPGLREGGLASFGLALLGLAGVAHVVKPAGAFGGVLPAVVGVVGALGSATAYIVIRSIGRTEHPLTVVLYFPMLSVVLSAVPTAVAFVVPTPLEALVLLGVGVTTTAAQVLLTHGLTLERASVATPISYTSLVFSGALGAAFFGEVPDARTVAGSVLIAAAAILLARRREAPSSSRGRTTGHGEPSEGPIARKSS